MATKKGSAVAKFGINISAFAAGGKFILRMQRDIGAGFRSIAQTAAGVATGIGLSRMTAQLSVALRDISQMAVEFDNIKAASGITASAVQKMRFSTKQRVGFGTASELLGDSGKMWDKYAGVIRDASVLWAAASERAKAAWAAVVGQIAPVFIKIMEDIRTSGASLVKMAEAFGSRLAKGATVVYNVLTSGKIMEVIKAGFDYAQKATRNIATWLVEGVAKTLPSAFMAVVRIFGRQLENVFVNVPKILGGGLLIAAAEFIDKGIPKIAEAFKVMLRSLADGLLQAAKGFIEVVSNPFKYINSENILNLSMKVKTAMETAFNSVSTTDNMRHTGRGMVNSGMEGIQQNFIATGKDLVAVMKKFVSVEMKDVAGAEKARSAMNDLVRLLSDNGRLSKLTGVRDIENRSIGQSYAVSSMAAIGGGGYVGPTSMQTMADNIRRQTSIQQSMDAKLGGILQALTSNAAVRVNPFALLSGGPPITITNLPRP